MYYYLLWLLLLLPLMAFSAWASARVNNTFSAYDKIENRSYMTGYETAVRLMRSRGVKDVGVQRVSGKLTDHYHPTKRTVNLSASTYGSDSVAAVAVAAHEVGHVMQRKEGYFPYKVRSALVPAANIGSALALPLVLIGILLDLFIAVSAPYSDLGCWLVYLGIGLYGLSTLFALVTLPVEYNASRRAKKMLLEEGILDRDEIGGADKVLSAAALTYVASLLISLFYLLRFAFFALSFLRRRN